MAFSLLHEFTVFSLFPMIIGDIIQRTAAAAINQQVTDGGQFLERIVHGEKISQNPGYLLFTAPYKLCEGGCDENDDENFAMAFPLYIGKRGLDKYHEIYARDHKNIHSEKPNAPFVRRPTQKLFTLCPSEVTTEKTTEVTTETETPTSETPSTTETKTTATAKSETTTYDITSESEYSTAESEPDTPTNEYTITTKSEITSTETAATTWIILTTESVTFTTINEETLSTAPRLFTNLETDFFITEPSINTNTETPLTEDSDTSTTITTPIPSTHFIYTTLSKTTSETPLPELTTTDSKTIKHKPRPNFETEDTKELETLAYVKSDEFYTTETTQLSTDVAETEDITFEFYTEGDYTDTTFVTNAKGVRCPPKKCGKKNVTPTIITLIVRNRPDVMKYDGRNADWNSDYSDLQDSLDFD